MKEYLASYKNLFLYTNAELQELLDWAAEEQEAWALFVRRIINEKKKRV